MPRRILRTRVTVAAGAVLLALTGLTSWLLLWPATSPPGRVDVVLVLAGGWGEREATGLRLAREGVAPVLVFSDGGGPATAWAPRCRLRVDGVRVVCLTPQISTTRGEARAFGELAAREGWRSVALVTSTYHVRRAGLMLDRCYPGVIQPVGAGPDGAGTSTRVSVTAHEAAGLLAAMTVQRGC